LISLGSSPHRTAPGRETQQLGLAFHSAKLQVFALIATVALDSDDQEDVAAALAIPAGFPPAPPMTAPAARGTSNPAMPNRMCRGDDGPQAQASVDRLQHQQLGLKRRGA
jgi:hypothetical protein